MAQSRVKTWSAGEVLTAADLNAEYNNILDNALSVISPLTGTLDAGNNAITNIGAAGTDFSATGGLTLADDLTISADDSRTNTVQYPAIFGGLTSGTPAASIGTGLRLQAESADESPSVLADLDFIFTDVTAGAEDSDFVLKLREAGAAAAEKFRVASDGTATLTGADAVTLGGVIDRDDTQASVTNTVTETTVYSYSVPANTLGTNRMLRLSLFGQYLNNSGASKTLTTRVKFGSTTVFTAADATISASASTRGYRLLFTLAGKGATNEQFAFGDARLTSAGSDTGTSADAGQGDRYGSHISVAEDTTGALTLSVTIQHDTAAATITHETEIAILELI